MRFRHLCWACIVTALLALSLSFPAYADRLQDILDKGVVRIGVPIDVPPFGFTDENQEPVGLDVDLAGMVAKELGVELELQQITGINRIPFLMTDKVDVVIAVMGATPERAKQIMFTSPYASLYIGVFGPRDLPVTSAATIGDYSVGVARGTTQETTGTKKSASPRWRPTPISSASRTTRPPRRPSFRARSTCSAPPTSWSRTWSRRTRAWIS
jgi:polar amino acid transport system substrate-binding protein